MGFTFICNMVCPDHIDNNKANNSYKNLNSKKGKKILAKGRRAAMMLAYERNTKEKRSAPRLDIIC